MEVSHHPIAHSILDSALIITFIEDIIWRFSLKINFRIPMRLNITLIKLKGSALWEYLMDMAVPQ